MLFFNFHLSEVQIYFSILFIILILGQKGYRKNPLSQGGTAPKIADPTTLGTSYEFPKPWMD